MKSFRSWLFESEFKDENVYGAPGAHWVHEKKVGNHQVSISFDGAEHPHHYHVAFMVGGEWNVNDSQAHEAAIFNHVRSVVHSFIKEKNPASLRLSATDHEYKYLSKKTDLYEKFAKRLARSHGGIYELEHPPTPYDGPVHVIWFKKK